MHDLRHTCAVLAALSGATLAEFMVRIGHSTQGRHSGISTPQRVVMRRDRGADVAGDTKVGKAVLGGFGYQRSE